MSSTRRSCRSPPIASLPDNRRALVAPADADFWAAKMKGQDFSSEDRLDTARFNSALWQGLGSGPEPSDRDGKDLRKNRQDLKKAAPAPCASD